MKKVHLLSKKRGGWKVLFRHWLAQYLLNQGESLEVIDTDPSNATLSGFKALKAQHIQLMEGDRLNGG